MKWLKSVWAWLVPAAKRGYTVYDNLSDEDKKKLQENAKRLSERVLKK